MLDAARPGSQSLAAEATTTRINEASIDAAHDPRYYLTAPH
jgi:hypothetical protein